MQLIAAYKAFEFDTKSCGNADVNTSRAFIDETCISLRLSLGKEEAQYASGLVF